MARVVGIDLAVKRRSSLAFMSGCELLGIANLRADEVVEAVLSWGADVVAIDAPLSEPPPHRINRDVEILARKIGLRLLPPGYGPMRDLTRLGIRIAGELSGATRVIEVHPSSSAKLMNLDRRALSRAFRGMDQADAVISAITALAYLLGRYVEIGPLVLPLENPCTSLNFNLFLNIWLQ